MLLQRVGEVARAANAAEPEGVTQREFDAARQRDERFADVPVARDVARKMDLPWHEVTELAQAPASTQQRRLSRKEGEERQDWLSPEHVAAVLRIVAARLGLTSLTQVEYSAERERMLAENRRRGPLLLPTEEQIRLAMRREVHGNPHHGTPRAGTWGRALKVAGLETNPKPKRKAVGRKQVELLERAYDAFGTQLTNDEIVVFAKANGIPYTPDTSRKWTESVAEWKRGRRKRGLPVPAGPPRRRERPDYSADVGAARAGERRTTKWSREACVAALVEYVEHFPSGQRAGADQYRTWVTAQPQAPDLGTLNRHGGWSKLLSLAREEVLRRRASELSPAQG